MFQLHDLRRDVKSSVTVNPTGLVTTRTNYLGAIRITETMAFEHSVHYYRVDKHAYPDDLSIGFKNVDEQHGYVRQHYTGIRDYAKGFENCYGYDVKMTIVTENSDSKGFELTFETRNLRSTVSIWNERERPEDWRWNDGLRARKNVYLSTEFEDYFEQERLTIKNLKEWAEVTYASQQKANQDRIQADVDASQVLEASINVA